MNVASLAAFVPASASHTVYAACKVFVVKFSESLSNEVIRSGVHVTALCPGLTRSEFHDVTGTRAAVRELPSWLWMDATQVAHEGFDAVMAGAPIHVTGPRQSHERDARAMRAESGARGAALLHEYPVGVGRFGPHFS